MLSLISNLFYAYHFRPIVVVVDHRTCSRGRGWMGIWRWGPGGHHPGGYTIILGGSAGHLGG